MNYPGKYLIGIAVRWVRYEWIIDKMAVVTHLTLNNRWWTRNTTQTRVRDFVPR